MVSNRSMKLCIGIGEEVSLIPLNLGEYQSGQLGQTVNLLSYDFIGSNPISPTTLVQGLKVGFDIGLLNSKLVTK